MAYVVCPQSSISFDSRGAGQWKFLPVGWVLFPVISEDQAGWHEWKGHVMRHQENVSMKVKCKFLKEVSTHSSPPAIRKEVIRPKGQGRDYRFRQFLPGSWRKNKICPVAKPWKLLETELIADFLVCLRKWEGIFPFGACSFSNLPRSRKNSFFEHVPSCYDFSTPQRRIIID